MPLSLAKPPGETSRIKAVIFDMDGLLLDTETLSFQSFVTTASRYDLVVGIDDYRGMIGLNAATGIDILRAMLPPQLDAVTFKNEWLDIYRQLLVGDVPVKAGAHAVLKSLHQVNMPCAVATSSSGRKARDMLTRTGLMPYLQHVTGGDEVPAGKPAPDVYLDVAQKLGVAADDCLAFEDSNNGTTAAIAAGMKVIQIPDLAPSNRPPNPPSFQICSSLTEAAALIGLQIEDLSEPKYTPGPQPD
ncbi:MAG: HAD family phosphatase [Candidatus Puniceispirillum sp.]|nr:HAD family phosphatase [Candidatus Puniceispirillum sp.]MBL6774491.1 HAD family phosphatase [Candidatus Puniceispirillum sp.]